MKKLAAFTIVVTIVIASWAFAADMSDIIPILKNTKKAVNSTLSEIDKDLKAAAKALSGIDLKSSQARDVLNDLRKFRPYIVDCSIVDPNGIKITVEPEEYKEYEGANRGDLPSVMALLKTKKPMMSDVYHSAEGMHAISIGYPIFSDKGEFLGAVRMLVKQEDFLKPLTQDRPCKIWVMQKNGLIVYDPDPEQVGKNIFSDDMFARFEDLKSFSRTVSLSPNGAGSYSFYTNGLNDKTLVSKIAAWDTVGIYGAEWRVIAMEIEKTLEEPEAEAPLAAKTAK